MSNIVLKIEEKLEPSRAEQIRAIFIPMANTLEGFEARYSEICAMEITADTCQKARRLRLDIAKIRTTTENVRKAEKEAYLRAGKAIDGVANILKFAVTEKEEKLEAIEKHFERQEEKRKAALAEERAEELAVYECFNVPGLGEMTDDIYSNFLAGTQLNYMTRKEAERKAEEDRIACEKAEAEERKRIAEENARLKKEAEEREKQLKIEREEAERKLAEERKKAEAERNAAEEKARAEKENVEAEARKIQAEKDAQLKAEREKREKLEVELKEKRDAENREKARTAREQKNARLAPDKDKLSALAKKIQIIELPDVSSEEARQTIREVQGLISKLAAFIEKRSSEL